MTLVLIIWEHITIQIKNQYLEVVKIGDGTLAFKFYSYTNVLAGIAATSCTGSKIYTSV